MDLDSQSGTYTLMLFLNQDFATQVGSLGFLEFIPGFYTYAGSAFGPGGLRARVGRHFLSPPKPHWHIDYLRQYSALVEVWFTCDPTRREHEWASTLGRMPGVSMPFPGFGASDCSCPAHLFQFGVQPRFHEFQSKLLERYPGHETVHCYFPEFHPLPRCRSRK